MNDLIYLDNAATSFPKPESVIRETQRCIRHYCVNAGRSSHKKSSYVNERIYLARDNIATLFGITDTQRIAFTPNTTFALNFALKGVLKKGDHLIISSMEHNSMLRPAHALLKQGITYSVAKANNDSEVTFENIKPLIKSNTKMVAIIHVSNVTGKINDITKIGEELKKRNIIFLVDAAQSAGIVPIDVRKSNINILCFPGHKGLFGPTGTGGIYVSEKTNISPIIQGGTGSMSESRFQPDEMPDLLESGTPNVLGISALCEGVKFADRYKSEILEHEIYLSDILCNNLRNINGLQILGRDTQNNTGVIAVKLFNRPPAEIAYLLDKNYNIATRAGFHCSSLAAETLNVKENGTLRFSIGFFNTKNDIEKTSYAMHKILN